MTVRLQDVQVQGKYRKRISLSALVGKRIADIHMSVDTTSGDFNMRVDCVVFDDGTELRGGAEHDFPFLVGTQPNFDSETFESLFHEEESR